jgi:N-acetylglucosaminyl-diphospho-decaprenol L-rhamnosyltransferase
VVSHGHGAQVEQLLRAISVWSDASLKKVVVTVNAPGLDTSFFDEKARDFPFALSVIRNSHPRGFGANHNRAFQECESDYFFVLNPDLELPTNPFPALLTALSDNRTGCAYPIQTSTVGTRQDFERGLPAPAAIVKRRFSRASSRLQSAPQPHWASGAFMAFNAFVFRKLGGFDERYFMYCEDVDICLRLQLAGFQLARADTTVIHHAQRQSLTNYRHLFWHVRSLLRLWNSAAYKTYRVKFLNGEQ